MFESISCYINCLWGTTLGYVMLGLILILIFTLLLFFITFRAGPMFTAQISTSAIIIVGFIGMKCPMIDYIWFYLIVIAAGLFILLLLQIGFVKRLGRIQISEDDEKDILSVYGLTVEHPLHFLDSQSLQAFTFRGAIFLSIGLLEMLEIDELKAVIAHESYHLTNTPDRRLAASLAIISLWFHSFRDERMADRYAATLVGEAALVSALYKLGVRRAQKRVTALHGS